MKKNKGVSALLVVALLIGAVLMPTVSAQKVVNEDKKEAVGDPWFVGIDDLNKLDTDKLLALAKQNETVRKLIEEDRKIEPAQIESFDD